MVGGHTHSAKYQYTPAPFLFQLLVHTDCFVTLSDMRNPFESGESSPTPEQLLESTKVTKLVWEANKKNGVNVTWKNDTWPVIQEKTGR